MGAVSFLDPYEKNRRWPLRALGQLAVLTLLALLVVLLIWLGRRIHAVLG